MTSVINKWPLRKYYSYNRKLRSTSPDYSLRPLSSLPPTMTTKLQKYLKDKSSTNSRKKMTGLETLSTRKKHSNLPMIIIQTPQELSRRLPKHIIRSWMKFRAGWRLSTKNYKASSTMALTKMSPHHTRKSQNLH